MSALPKAVQAQIARANKLVDELNANKTGQPPALATVPTNPAPAPAVAPEPTAPPAAPAEPPAAPTDWEHKFKVLQGKYNAEVPRLNRQVQEQEQTLRDMRQQLTNTQSLLASLGSSKSAEVAPPAQPAQRRVKDDEIRTFGADLYDFIKRSALEAVEPELSRVAQPIEKRLAKTEQAAHSAAETASRTAVEKVYDLLFSQVPNWEELNASTEFLSWLELPDPYTGVLRSKLLAQAYQAHDGPRVVAFFKGFLNENAAVSPTPAPAPASAPSAPAPEVQLQSMVAPGTPKSGPQGGAPDEAGKRVWTQADAQALYRKINEYTKKGKQIPKDLRTLEADLVRANAEGRLKV